MIKFIKIFFMLVLGLFPDTPFPDAVEGMDTSYFVYLNWFFPLDNMLNIFLLWVDSMLVVLVIKLLWKILLDKLLSMIKGVKLLIKK